MIGIFHGRGITDTARAHAQIDVDLRNHIHEFNNGHNVNAFGVFICIALHANKEGWAWPSWDLLKSETGLKTDSAISNAIKHLREEATVQGHRVLAQYRLKDRGNKRWDHSLYLIFPDLPHAPPPADVTEGRDIFIVKDGKPRLVEPPPIDPGVGDPGMGDPDVGELGYKKNHEKLEPSQDVPSLEKDRTVDEIKALSLTASQWGALLEAEKRGKHRKSVIKFIDAKMNGTKHPAIAAFREEMQRFPRRSQYPVIIEAVGHGHDNVDLWRRVVRGWNLAGWNPVNVGGMLDFFGRNEIPGTSGGRGRSNSRSRSQQDKKPPLVDERTQEELEGLRQRIRAHRGGEGS